MKEPVNPEVRNMFGFTLDESRVKSEAERAVNRICGAGLLLEGDRVMPGTNNVMADFAAIAFLPRHLAYLRSQGPVYSALSDIISLRQIWSDQTDMGISPDDHDKLNAIYTVIEDLAEKDLWTLDTPVRRLDGPRFA